MTLRRGKLVTLNLIGDNQYHVIDRLGNTLIDAEKDYFIYVSEVAFVNGQIKARYLGEATEGLLDSRCLDVCFDGSNFTVNGRVIEKARMVAVDNKNGTIVIIEEE